MDGLCSSFFSHSAQRPVRKVMELACGTGEVSMRLDDKGYEVIGVDLSKNMLEIAEKESSRETYRMASSGYARVGRCANDRCSDTLFGFAI